MNSVCLRRKPFIVAARSPSVGDSAIGSLELECDQDSFPFYFCADSEALLNSVEHRVEVAADIIRRARETFQDVSQFTFCVLIHKNQPEFINAMLGLADELLKHGVDLHVVAPNSGGTIGSLIAECINAKNAGLGWFKRRKYPLLRLYRAGTLWDLEEFLAAARRKSEE